MELRVYDRQDHVTALGPGVRYALWVQGCHRRCPGCMTPESRPLDGGKLMDVHLLAEEIVAAGVNGITISGGEPFLQSGALVELLHEVKRWRDIGVIVYTGFTLEELRGSNNTTVEAFLDEIDLLIDGPYIEEMNDGKNLRGSSNQRVLCLTERYRAEAADYGTQPANVEFFFSGDKVSMVGIPSKEILERVMHINF